MIKVALLGHGESTWNQENRFTGWADVGLTERGLQEARTAGEMLTKEGFAFDVAFTSVLKRVIKTLWVVLEAGDHADSRSSVAAVERAALQRVAGSQQSRDCSQVR